MTLAEFRANLDLYSGDLSRWPDALAEEALALISASEQAQDLFAAAAALDLALQDARDISNKAE